MLGHYRPASETPFGWRFACGPIVARFYVLTGYSQANYKDKDSTGDFGRTAEVYICDPVYPSIRCSHTQSRYEDAILSKIHRGYLLF